MVTPRLSFCRRLLRQLARASRYPWVRTAWVARPFLYAALGAVALAGWHARAAVRMFDIDLDVEASAPCAAPAGEQLPVRVVIRPMTGGCVRSDLRWRAIDGGGATVADGDVECYGGATILLHDAARVRAIDFSARGPHGERSLRLQRTSNGPIDRAATTCMRDAPRLWAQAGRERRVAEWFAAAGIVICGIWLVAEIGAWLARAGTPGATWPWQCVAALMCALPFAAALWDLGAYRFRVNLWIHRSWIAELMMMVRSPFR